MRPPATEYLDYFERYISLVPGEKVVPVLTSQIATVRGRLAGLSDTQASFRYAPDKWSVRESLGHLIDTERVFGYRALWFARGNTEPLPGMDQDPFAASAHHDACNIDELVDEFCSLRESHVQMFNHLPKEAWTRIGKASGHPLSTRAAAFIMAGHVEYHLKLFAEKYGV